MHQDSRGDLEKAIEFVADGGTGEDKAEVGGIGFEARRGDLDGAESDLVEESGAGFEDPVDRFYAAFPYCDM